MEEYFGGSCNRAGMVAYEQLRSVPRRSTSILRLHTPAMETFHDVQIQARAVGQDSRNGPPQIRVVLRRTWLGRFDGDLVCRARSEHQGFRLVPAVARGGTRSVSARRHPLGPVHVVVFRADE